MTNKEYLEVNKLVDHLYLVITYLEGKTDIYDGHHNDTIQRWNEVWDEMKYLGYNPETRDGIFKYICEQL